jgi:hypothetical protein
LPVRNIRNTALKESEPQAVVRTIGGQCQGEVLISKFGPGEIFDQLFVVTVQKPCLLVGDPEVSWTKFHNVPRVSGRDTGDS